MLRPISTCARYTVGSPAAAGNVGSRESAQLSLTTGLAMRHPSRRSRTPASSSPSTSAAVRTGSALLTTARARIVSPPSRRTPSPGTIAATGTPAASTAPRVRARHRRGRTTPGPSRPRRTTTRPADRGCGGRGSRRCPDRAARRTSRSRPARGARSAAVRPSRDPRRRRRSTRRAPRPALRGRRRRARRPRPGPVPHRSRRRRAAHDAAVRGCGRTAPRTRGSRRRRPATIASTDAAVFAASCHWNNDVPSANGRPLRRVDDERPVPVLRELELLDDQRVQQPDEVGARAHHEPVVGERALERARAAELVAPLEDEDGLAGAREVRRGGESVVPTADDHDVPVARGELGDRRGQPDAAHRLERAHGLCSSPGPT